jgi:signal transduction histidine kinase
VSAIISRGSKRFISIRWKLVITYLILILATLLLVFGFIYRTMVDQGIEEKQENLLTQTNIFANQLVPLYEGLDNVNTRDYAEGLIKDFSLEIASRVMLIDEAGIVMIDAHEDLEGIDLSHVAEVQGALSFDNRAKMYRSDESGYLMYVAVPVISSGTGHGVLFVSSDANDLYERIRLLFARLGYLAVVAVGVAGILSYIFAKFLADPISHLTESVKAITLGQHDISVSVDGNDELSNLGAAFNLMARRLDQVDQTRKRFVSNVSHELRTPLASMKILSESLLGQSHWEEDIYREFMQDISGEVDRLDQIIESLLYLSEIEKEELELDYSVTYVNYLIERVIKTLRPLAEKKNQQLTFGQAKRIQIELDQAKIQQALINIIGNAIKYTPEGGQISVQLYEEKDRIRIDVADTGLGIPEKDLEFIFDRFYRIDEARNRKTGGTGLGLSISDQIVKLHQGEIRVKSEVGKGSVFSILLPANKLFGGQ